MGNNLELWDKVGTTDPKMTKEVKFGRKFTAIDPIYQIRKATEQFGSYGKGFGLREIVHNFTDFVDERGNSVLITSAIFFYPGGEFPLTTSSKMFTGKEPKYDEDVFKKIETDLTTKALSKLGFNADVFLGKFDDNKYVADRFQEEAIKESIEPINSEQTEEIKKLMAEAEVDPEKFFVFAKAASAEDIKAANYDKIKKMLLAKVAAKLKKEQNENS